MIELAYHDRAFWDDGEWFSWDEINQQIEYKEWRAKYPNADISLVPIFESLLSTACSYNAHTGKHLHVYGDIGELYGAITHGIRLNRNYAKGSARSETRWVGKGCVGKCRSRGSPSD